MLVDQKIYPPSYRYRLMLILHKTGTSKSLYAPLAQNQILFVIKTSCLWLFGFEIPPANPKKSPSRPPLVKLSLRLGRKPNFQDLFLELPSCSITRIMPTTKVAQSTFFPLKTKPSVTFPIGHFPKQPRRFHHFVIWLVLCAVENGQVCAGYAPTPTCCLRKQ